MTYYQWALMYFLVIFPVGMLQLRECDFSKVSSTLRVYDANSSCCCDMSPKIEDASLNFELYRFHKRAQASILPIVEQGIVKLLHPVLLKNLLSPFACSAILPAMQPRI